MHASGSLKYSMRGAAPARSALGFVARRGGCVLHLLAAQEHGSQTQRTTSRPMRSCSAARVLAELGHVGERGDRTAIAHARQASPASASDAAIEAGFAL